MGRILTLSDPRLAPRLSVAGWTPPKATLAEFLEMLGRSHREVDLERPGAIGEGGISAGMFRHPGVARWLLLVAPAMVERIMGLRIDPSEHDPCELRSEEPVIPLAAAFGTQGYAWQTVRATTGATSIFDGLDNQTKILAMVGSNPAPAVQACDALSVTVSGTTYADWYLPARRELGRLVGNSEILNAVNNADTTGEFLGEYWSSTEFDSSYAEAVISTNQRNNRDKNTTYRVRPVRRIAA